MTIPAGHPWLDALKADPAGEIRALIDGFAAITPYERAEPADAAAMMLASRPGDDAARDALDQGCLAVLRELRDELRSADEQDFPFVCVAAQRLLALILRIAPAAAVADLHNRYVHWFDCFENTAIDQGLDVRREYLRVLALTQSQNGNPRRLMPLWLDVCTEAGNLGRYNLTYLDVGLLGLRKLPIGGDIASNEEAVCMGLALWAAYQLPDKKTLQSRWWEIDAAYPRDPDYWPPLINKALQSAKEKLGGADIAAAPWWRDAAGGVDESPQIAHSDASESGVLPDLDAREIILKNKALDLDKLEPGILALTDKHRAYADQTGDTYYLVRTFCNIGQELMGAGAPGERKRRGEVAVRLARMALDYQTADPFIWSMWRDGLDNAGAPAAARAVAWESCRRFPEDEKLCAQLAKLLRSHGLIDEARRVLELGLKTFPTHDRLYTQLAILLADDLHNRPAAIDLLHLGAKKCGTDHAFQTLLDKATGDRRLGKRLENRQDDAQSDYPVTFAAGDAHRGLMLWQSAANNDERDAALAEVRRVLHADPALAYARYVAVHTGAEAVGADGGLFAFALARALRDNDWTKLQNSAGDSLRNKIVAGLAGDIIAGNIPKAPANMPNSPALDRLKTVITGVSAVIRPDKQASLRLLAAFAASELSPVLPHLLRAA